MARVDFRLGLDDVPYFLELNPLPGLSPYYSIFPKQAAEAGIDESKLIEILLRNGLRGTKSNKKKACTHE
jgi:D-alanine-D-alanine ligase